MVQTEEFEPELDGKLGLIIEESLLQQQLYQQELESFSYIN